MTDAEVVPLPRPRPDAGELVTAKFTVTLPREGIEVLLERLADLDGVEVSATWPLGS